MIKDLRTELAREIEMAGLTRVAQAGEHRWLELEEKLGVAKEESSSDFESAIMDVLPENSSSKQSSKIIAFPRIAWIGLAALGILIFQMKEKNSPETGVAQVIRIESEEESSDQNRILRKGEEFTIEQGLVEMAFRETGVNLVGTGPLHMTIMGNDRVFLKRG